MSLRYPSTGVGPSPLGQPLNFPFAGKDAPNCFLKAAMMERLSSWSSTDLPGRGVPSSQLINVYRRFGEGGIGLMLTGNTMIAYDQLEAAGNAIIPPDAPFHGLRFEAFKELASQAKKHGSLIVSQVSHPGRQVFNRINASPILASDVQLKGDVLHMTFGKPRAATQADIKSIVEAFTHAAEYLYRAGFDGIELHGAHGYLLSQVLSPDTNVRTDQYGGSFCNRARIILEIAHSIRARLPSSSGFIVGIKVNSVEFQHSGKNFTAEECRDLCSLLESDGEFDFVELSGRQYETSAFEHKRESTKMREAYFLEFADAVVPGLTKTKVYVTGGFKTVPGMVKALDTIDGVGLGRVLCQEPRSVSDVLAGRVKSAIERKLDENDFGLMNLAAGTQMRQVGKDFEPVDLSGEANVTRFMEELGKWMAAMGQDREGRMYGYIDMEDGAPYGTVAP